MSRENTCSVCEIPIRGKYCSRCGQKLTEGPTTLISLISDFLSNFFSMDRSAFATIFKILKNPYPIVQNYYSGFRNYYASPGKILLYGIAVVALHLRFVNDTVMGLSLDLENFDASYLFWIVLFPVLLFSSFITFIRIERGLTKHLISLIYIASSLFIIITILNDLIIMTFGDKLGLWTFISFVFLIFLWNSRVFSAKKNPIYILLNTIIQIGIFMCIVGMLILFADQRNNK